MLAGLGSTYRTTGKPLNEQKQQSYQHALTSEGSGVHETRGQASPSKREAETHIAAATSTQSSSNAGNKRKMVLLTESSP